jgi:hypothetical protein
MKYCPNCGSALDEGVTRCWKQGCGYVLPAPNKRDELDYHPPKSERMKELELEYALARRGLGKGIGTTIAAILSGLFTLLASAIVLVFTDKTLLTGNQIVLTFGILAIAIVLYFAFIFGRAAKIKAEIRKEKIRIEIGAGEKVR